MPRGARLLCLVLLLAPDTRAVQGADFESAKPAVRVEYWQRRQIEISDRLKDSRGLAAVKLVFLGDSITDFWTMGANPWIRGTDMGRRIWDESFGGRPPGNLALNLGISGDRTEHVLNRILPQAAGGLGELDPKDLDPDFVILMIGINNTWAGEEPVAESVAAGIHAVVDAVHDRKPRATVILQSLLPTQDEAKNRDVVRVVNQRLLELSSGRPYMDYVRFLDLYPAFVDPAGKEIGAYFCDGLHPNESGYRVWRDKLVPFLEHARGPRGN
jgi:lysophospholipase L1-like esterase